MGAAVSVKQQNEIPPLMDRKTFYQVTGTNFGQDAYDCFVDNDGFVSKDRLIEVASASDCYLSHDWGLDEHARSTHDRVVKIWNYLSKKGLFITGDNGPDMNIDIGETAATQVEKKIRKTQCVIVFLTTRYYELISQPNHSVAKEEFFTALSNKGPRFMLPVLLENAAKLSPNNTTEVIYELFKNKYTVDCTNFEKCFSTRREKHIKIIENTVLDDLYDCILKTIKPLKNGGSYVAQNFIRDNTIPGRHYHWLKTYIPQWDHTKCLKYSSVFTDAGVTTSSKLFHLIQCDDKYLLKLGINLIDAKLIYKKLHDDIVGNMNPVAAIKIDAIISKCDAVEQQRLDVIKQETQRTTDIAIMNTENVAMSIEDAISYEDREEWRRTTTNIQFNESKMRLLQESLEQTHQLHSRIHLAQKIMFQQYCSNIDAQRTADYIRITHIKSADLACSALRHLLLKIQREVDQSADNDSKAFMMGRTNFKDSVDVVDYVKAVNNEATSVSQSILLLKDSPEKEPVSDKILLQYIEDENGKECVHLLTQSDKVEAYIQKGFMNRDSIVDDERTDAGAGDYNGNAIYNLLHESVIVLHLISVLCRDNPSSRETIHDFTDNSVVKLWTPLMNIMYLFNYTFDSSAILSECDPSYHILSAPLEGLLAMKYLCKFSPYRYSVNLKLVYLFGSANTIELCLEIVKFHFTDLDVVLAGLECIAILMDNVEYYREYSIRLMSDRNTLTLLLMLLNKYSLYCDDGVDEFYKLRLQSMVLNILGLVIRTNQYNALLFKFHVQYVVGDCLLYCIQASKMYLSEDFNVNAKALIELNIRLLNTLDCIYLDHSHVINFNSTEDSKAAFDAIGQLTVKRLSTASIISWFAELFRFYRDDNCFCQYISYTIGNVVYNNEQAKLESVRSGVIPSIVKLAAHNMSNYNDKLRVTESRDTVLDCVIALSNLLIWQHDATNVIQYNNESFNVVRNGGSRKMQRFEQVSLKDTAMAVVILVVEEGYCEVIMNIFREYSTDRSLVRAGLIACCKLCYRGQYEPCHRLVSLGLCEYVMKLYHIYSGETEMYFLFIVLFTGLSEAHPNLVGATKRLLKFGLCKLITEAYRHNCKVSGSRKWPHLNFPFTCRVCMQTCQCVFSLTKDHSGAEVVKKFNSVGFQGSLLKPPDLVCDDLKLDEIEFPPTAHEHMQQESSSLYSIEDECAPTPLKTSSDLAMITLFEADRFNRNIEYAVNATKEEKQETMSTLFNLFHIE